MSVRCVGNSRSPIPPLPSPMPLCADPGLQTGGRATGRARTEGQSERGRHVTPYPVTCGSSRSAKNTNRRSEVDGVIAPRMSRAQTRRHHECALNKTGRMDGMRWLRLSPLPLPSRHQDALPLSVLRSFLLEFWMVEGCHEKISIMLEMGGVLREYLLNAGGREGY